MAVLAVDFGGTKTSLALVDAAGAARDRRRLPAARTVEGSARQVAAALGDATAVGVIVPGIYAPATGRAWCPNLWGTDEQPLLEALRARVGVPVAIDNDRVGAVLGEAWLGAARGLRDVAFVAIGTGIGVGILCDGRVVRGAHGIAGAAGWFALDPSWKDAYQATGCWEAEAAGPAIARAFGTSDAAAVFDAAREGDAVAHAVLDHAARYTGMGVANLISALDPEAVILGGGIVHAAGERFVERVRSEARRWAQPMAASRCRIDRTTLDQDAGLLGAARLALDSR
jgi:glucokinase